MKLNDQITELHKIMSEEEIVDYIMELKRSEYPKKLMEEMDKR